MVGDDLLIKSKLKLRRYLKLEQHLHFPNYHNHNDNEKTDEVDLKHKMK